MRPVNAVKNEEKSIQQLKPRGFVVLQDDYFWTNRINIEEKSLVQAIKSPPRRRFPYRDITESVIKARKVAEWIKNPLPYVSSRTSRLRSREGAQTAMKNYKSTSVRAKLNDERQKWLRQETAKQAVYGKSNTVFN